VKGGGKEKKKKSLKARRSKGVKKAKREKVIQDPFVKSSVNQWENKTKES